MAFFIHAEQVTLGNHNGLGTGTALLKKEDGFFGLIQRHGVAEIFRFIGDASAVEADEPGFFR